MAPNAIHPVPHLRRRGRSPEILGSKENAPKKKSSGKEKFEVLTMQFPLCASAATLQNRIMRLAMHGSAP